MPSWMKQTAFRFYQSVRDKTASASYRDTLDDFGLLELASGNDAVIDIVALHGLDGHREASWTADNGVLWLRDLLPSQIPHARIFSYGYDVYSRGQDQFSTASLHTHAVNLITHLASIRESSSTEERPIIFVAHSLGGILLKHALLYAYSCGKSNLPNYKAIEVSTSGVLFFGTPHQGSKFAGLGTIVLNMLSFGRGATGILKSVRIESEMLQQQLIQYQAISSNYDTKFYFETYKTTVGPLINLLLVPQSSAVVPGAVNAEMIPLNKDHVNMVKFKSAADGAFQLVSANMSSMVAKAHQKVENRWKRHKEFEDNSSGAILGVSLQSGNASGTILKTDPAPLPLLPYQEAGDSLIGRSHSLEWIHKMFKKHRNIVLYGIGGIGKTRIAVEYVYAHRHDYDIIFWVNGDTLETTTSGFVVLAQQLVNWKVKYLATSSSSSGCDYSRVAHELGLNDLLDSRGKLSNKVEDRADILSAVRVWLSHVRSGNWLMVFDNVDDLDSFDLITFFPTPLVGRILITSRRRESVFLGTGYEVTALSQDDSVRLLTEKCQRGPADSTAHQIVRMLEGLPLAIELAGAYMAALQLSFKSYLMTSHESWRHVFSQNLRPYGRSLVATWEISYQAIHSRSPCAAKLLLLCAFLGSEDIPEQIFQANFGIAIVNEALTQLFGFSLAKRGPSETSFSIHPLVHAWARERLDEHQKNTIVTEMVILLGGAISQMPLSWSHTFISAKHALEYCLPKLHTNSDTVIFESLGKIAEREGGELLRGMFRFALKATESMEGPDSLPTFTAMELLGRSYFGFIDRPVGQFLRDALQQERYSNTGFIVSFPSPILTKETDGSCNVLEGHINAKEQKMEGEKLVQYALEGRQRVLGFDHPDTLHTIHCLAEIIWVQGRFAEAEELERRALQGREKVLGKYHDDTLLTLHNLARSIYDQGRFDEAEQLERGALEGQEKVLGTHHTATLQTVHDMAVSMHIQGRFGEAEKLHRRALEGRENLLGLIHADTLHSVAQLAVSIFARGRFEEAETLQLRALKGRERLLGLNHVDTLQSVYGLAVSIHAQGRYEEAEMLKRRALEGSEKLLGLDHVDTLQRVEQLAVSIHAQGRFKEAETLKRRALEGHEKLLGLDHAGTLQSAYRLALSIHAQGRFGEAEILSRRVLQGRETLMGLNHIDTFRSIYGLAVSIHAQHRFEEAEKLYRRALVGCEKLLGWNHPDTFKSVQGLALSIYDQGRFQEAETLSRRAFQGRENFLGLNHICTLKSMDELALSIWAQGRFEEAEKLGRCALEGRKKVLGLDNADTLTSLHNLAQIMHDQGAFEEAEILGRCALAGREKNRGLNHADTLQSASNLALSIRRQGRFEEAQRLEHRVAEGKKAEGTGYQY